MSKSADMIRSSMAMLEVTAKKFTLRQATPGVSFDDEEKVMIPSGSYVVVEPDDRDKDRVIVSNSKTFELYSIGKSHIK